MIEAIVSNQFRRYYPTYYIKAESEIDVAYVDQERFWPIEVKWRNQLRPHDLKQILKYPRAVVYAKTLQPQQIQGCAILPLPLALIRADR